MWQKHCLAILEKTGESLSCQDVVWEYLATCSESVNEVIILSAWRESGTQPLNPQVFKDSDFAASFSSSIKLQFTPSFPISPKLDAFLSSTNCDDSTDGLGEETDNNTESNTEREMESDNDDGDSSLPGSSEGLGNMLAMTPN